MRWIRLFSYAVGSLIALVAIAFGVVLTYQHISVVNEGNGIISEWKKSDWIRSGNLDLFKKALSAAEDPSFISEPRLDCGFVGTVKALSKNDPFACSPIIGSAARMAISGTYRRSLSFKFAWLAFSDELSERPEDAIDIILNKSYLGSKPDGTQVVGFEQAAKFYFGRSISALKVSQVALLTGMLKSPGIYSPQMNPSRAKERRDHVIDQMAKSASISEAEALAAKSEPLL